MKKCWLFIIISFIFIPNVYAYEIEDYSVCKDDCPYQTLEEAFIAIEQNTFPLDGSNYYVEVLDKGTQTIGSHTFTRYVDVEFFQDVIIEGENSTLYTNDEIYFECYYDDVDCDMTINNLNFETKNWDYKNGNNNLLFDPDSKGLYMNNVSIIHRGDNISNMMSNVLFGIYLDCIDEIIFHNVTISGFSVAGYNSFSLFSGLPAPSDPNRRMFTNFDQHHTKIGNPPTVDSYNRFEIYDSSFENNLCSFSLDSFDISINQSDFTHLLLQNCVLSVNNISPRKIATIPSSLMEQYMDLADSGTIYIVGDDSTLENIEVQQNDSIDLSVLKNYNLMDFVDGDINQYTFQLSNSSVASIENGVLTFLKDGDVTLTIVNRNTGFEYTIEFHITKPFVNPKTINSVLIGFILFIGILFSFILLRKKEL